MHMRTCFAASSVLLAALIIPTAAEASIGIGIQAGPVRLSGAAHPGGIYSLPRVLVVNTGTQTESVVIEVERVSPGRGLTVPPSWVREAGPTVSLAHDQSSRIPLRLVVPATAKAGSYVSDVIARGSAGLAAGSANLGVAAATKLEFTIVPGAVSGSSLAPAWLIAGIGMVFGVLAALIYLRWAGWRIRIVRETPAGEPASGSTDDGA